VPAAPTLDDETLTFASARARFGVDLREPKFTVPQPRDQSVRRSELLARLEHGCDRPVVLLTAPAGYGKTTLLSQWAQDSARPCAWATLAQVDGAPGVLARSVANALAQAGIEAGQGSGFTLVLDDAHIVPPEVLGEELRDILTWLPAGAQVALGSRREPPLALGRMRAQRMLIEFGSADLAMSAVEVASLLRNADLDPEFLPVQTLVRRTEGWPVAVELATVQWAGRPDAAEPVTSLTGDDHLISEYFRGEILASLSPAAVRFLTRASVLDRLSGPLCDAALGRWGSATVLAELARANVPLQALDPSHEWYRLHGLFREMLQTELRRSEPDAAPLVHRRAEGWYRRAGDIDRALDHASHAEDLDGLGELLWTHLPRYLARGRNDQVQRWLHGVTAERATGSAPLALAAAHSNLVGGNVAVAEQWARSAAVRLSGARENSSRLDRAGVLIIQAWTGSGATGMARLAARAYELLPGDCSWRASCCLLRGTAALLAGDNDAAERFLQEGAARGAALAPASAGLCLAQLAVIAVERGEPVVASDFAFRARTMVVAHDLATEPASALVFAVCAAAAMREGRADEAKAAVSESLRLLNAFEDSLPWYGAETRILVARTSLALGDVAGARELLADASRLARRTSNAVIFARWFEDAWDQFDQRAEGTLAGVASLTTAELRVLRFLPTHYSFQEIAQRLHVSSNTVKTHVHAVYRKLDASSRSEAVRHAIDTGLLC
jgi:LuxR family transcriptional regulator, maltose regulon positive regulatory protein